MYLLYEFIEEVNKNFNLMHTDANHFPGELLMPTLFNNIQILVH